jgi:hypothetical protein
MWSSGSKEVGPREELVDAFCDAYCLVTDGAKSRLGEKNDLSMTELLRLEEELESLMSASA